jgi:hypothetical protein
VLPTFRTSLNSHPLHVRAMIGAVVAVLNAPCRIADGRWREPEIPADRVGAICLLNGSARISHLTGWMGCGFSPIT